MEFLSQALPRMLDPEEFRNPGPAFRPVMMWIWNANLDRVTLREQVAEMAARGIGGFFIHPMPDAFRKHDFIEGITEPYPGEMFFEWVKDAAEVAREHGFFCWLYDEGGWPSGTLVGRLADGRPELAGRVLRVQCLEAGDTGAPDAGSGTEEEVVTLPAPGGRRLRFYANREGYPTDLMNPATTEAFLAATHDAYARCLDGEFGGLVPGVFTDEAAVGGVMGTDRVPWTPALPEEFRRRKGYDLLPYLPVLFGDAAIPAEARPALSPEQAARVRYDFGDVWTRLHADAFYGRMSEWCREHGLLLVGHVGGEDDLIYHATRGFGHFFRIMRYLDVPGVDAIWHQLFPGEPRSHFSKLAGSAARVHGKPLALSETFAVYGYGLTYAQMKWVTDRQFGDGINVMVPMAAPYTTTRGRTYGTMSNLAWGNPNWPLFKTYADYTARLSYLSRLGRPVARVALFYPASSLWVEADPAIAKSFHSVMDLLQEAQIDFDIVDEEDLAGASVESGTLRIGVQAYQAVVLSDTRALPWAVVERLAAFKEAGGAVAAVDRLPWLCAEAEHQAEFKLALGALFSGERARFFPPEERVRLPEFLARLISRDFVLETPDSNIRYSHRVWDETRLYFVVNASETARAITAVVAGTGSVDLWDPDRGTVTPVEGEPCGDRTRVHLELPPLGSVFVVVRPGGQPRKPHSEPTPAGELPLKGSWEIAPVRVCQLVQGEARVDAPLPGCEAWSPTELRPWAELGLGTFSGSIAYRRVFSLSELEAARKAVLDLGTVKYAAEVWVNGQAVGARLWPPFTLDVTGYLRPGRNEIRVVVTNTWANQFLQPEEMAHARERGWYNTYAQRVEPFQRESLESGLLGPVSLRLFE